MWSLVLFDTMTGQLGAPIDIPNFSWQVDVNTSTLNTTRDRRPSMEDVSNLTVPWTGIPGDTGLAKSRSIATLRTSVALMWDGIPILAGAIGNRVDNELDTSFSLISVLDLLDNRIMCKEGTFGANVYTAKAGNNRIVETHATSSKYEYRNLSQRAIACEVIAECTNAKPGGMLPIRLPYLGEESIHYTADGKENQNYWRTYYGYNVENNSGKDILTKLATTSYGPDMQFRPALASENRIEYQFVAGSDAEPYLAQTGLIKTLTHFAGGGTLQSMSVSHDYAAQRVYFCGSGTDEAMNCGFAEDLRLVTQADPWPLIEIARSDQDISGRTVDSRAAAILALKNMPIMQIEGTIDANDPYAPKLGTFWPGELMRLHVQDFPSVPDGTYDVRLMEMSGTQGTTVKLLFDVMVDPTY